MSDTYLNVDGGTLYINEKAQLMFFDRENKRAVQAAFIPSEVLTTFRLAVHAASRGDDVQAGKYLRKLVSE